MVPRRISWLCKAVSFLKLSELARVLRFRMTKSMAIDGPRCEEEDIDLFLLRALQSFTSLCTDLIPRQEIISGAMPVSGKLAVLNAE